MKRLVLPVVTVVLATVTRWCKSNETARVWYTYAHTHTKKSPFYQIKESQPTSTAHRDWLPSTLTPHLFFTAVHPSRRRLFAWQCAVRNYSTDGRSQYSPLPHPSPPCSSPLNTDGRQTRDGATEFQFYGFDCVHSRPWESRSKALSQLVTSALFLSISNAPHHHHHDHH